MLTPAQQKQAIEFLKEIVDTADEQNPGDLGYDDHADTMKLRLFLIKIGAMPDRREKKTTKKEK